MAKNIFVVGLDNLNKAALERLHGTEKHRFYQLLTREELVASPISVPDLLRRARHILDNFRGPVNAIVGYWDFPGSMLVPVLAEEYGTRATSLRSVLANEHKYWSRLKQSRLIDEIPRFGLLDLESTVPILPPGVNYPVWIKPVKSCASQGAYYVDSPESLLHARDALMAEVGRVGEAFTDFLARTDLPVEISGLGGYAAIAEEEITGHQFTVEGFVQDKNVTIYGSVDSIRYPNCSSFLRYQYPSRLPAPVRTRAKRIGEEVVAATGLNDTTFNIEFFWDENLDALNLLEVNVRHSQSHALLFERVDGFSNHAFMLDLALGNEPTLPRGEGPDTIAAKWFIRSFQDGVVKNSPTSREIRSLEKRFPGTVVQVMAREGQRLSQSYGEDSYSYILAEIHTGGRTEEDLHHIFEVCRRELQFDIVSDLEPGREITDAAPSPL